MKKQHSITGLVLTFCNGAVVYKSKTQSLIAGSSTESEFIAAHMAAKIPKYLQMILKQLGYKQKSPTSKHLYNWLSTVYVSAQKFYRYISVINILLRV